MKTIKKFIYSIFMLIVIFIFVFSSFAQENTSIIVDNIICSDCHTCVDPTAQINCLKACPSITKPTASFHHDLMEAPDVLNIDIISDLFQGVIFNHKLHADMAQMGSGCETCHHYSPEGKIPACGECHGNKKDPNNLSQPSLKGAYHRQCLSCHREWSHDTKCIVCHLPSSDDILSAEYDSTDIIGISHPKISVPTKKVFHTSYEDGDIVTFYHSEHIDRFDLKCVDCHKQENCNYCHSYEQLDHVAKTEKEVHALCNDCHKKDNCDMCHDAVERPPFDHASTGWKLSKYHNKLECRNCHPTGKRITTMNADCKSCHSGWSLDNFRHEVTGLHLDEIHSDFDCEDCHVDLKYHNKPSCDNCHDDGKNYKNEPPGHR